MVCAGLRLGHDSIISFVLGVLIRAFFSLLRVIMYFCASYLFLKYEIFFENHTL